MGTWSFRGRVRLADMNPTTGKPENIQSVGSSLEVKFSLNVEKQEIREGVTSKRGLLDVMYTSAGGSVSVKFDELSDTMIALAMQSEGQDVAAAAFPEETFPTEAAGEQYKLDAAFPRSIVITDSAGSPATLVAGTHYTAKLGASGVVTFLDVAGLTQPFKVNGNTVAHVVYPLLQTLGNNKKYFLFDGENTRNANQHIGLELPIVQFAPLTDFDLINESFGGVTLTGDLLFSELHENDTTMGGYGRFLINGKDFTGVEAT